MTQDHQFLKALHIAPCEIPEPPRSTPDPAPKEDGEGPESVEVDFIVSEGTVFMKRADFDTLMNVNHTLADRCQAHAKMPEQYYAELQTERENVQSLRELNLMLNAKNAALEASREQLRDHLKRMKGERFWWGVLGAGAMLLACGVVAAAWAVWRG